MPATKQHLTHLESTRLLRLAQTHPELEFIFRHALMQDAAYELLLLADRKQLHKLVGKMQAAQLEDDNMKNSFLNSALVQEIRVELQ